MAVAVQTSAQIFLDEFRFGASATNAAFGVSLAKKNATTFGSGGFEMSTTGLKMLDLNLTGFNDFGSGALDEWMRSNYGTTQVISVGPGVEATGSTVVITQGIPDMAPSFEATVGDIPVVKFACKPVGQVIGEGQVTQTTGTAITVTGNTTPVQVGATTAAQQMRAAIHILAVTGTTPTITFQIASSTTSGGAYTTRGSAGSSINIPSGQFLATGAIGAITDTWWRLNYVVTGSAGPSFTTFASLAPA